MGSAVPVQCRAASRARLADMPLAQAGVVPWTLRAGAALVSAEALVEALVVSGRSELTTGLRLGLIISIALKWVFAWRVLRLSAGAMLGLLMLEGTTVVAALGAVETTAVPRVALGLVALLTIGLLLASLPAFPPPRIPGA